MKKSIIFGIIIIILAVYIIWHYSVDSEKKSGVQGAKDLANCLKNKGVKFYGAYYCSHCKKQKEMFGDYASILPYIECEGNPKNSECAKARITGYPTWVFPDGKRLAGEVNLEQLKEYSNC